MVAVVAIGVGLGRPLGEKLSGFAKSMLGPGGYYSCLMKNAKLPNDPALASSQFKCNEKVTKAQGELKGGFPGLGGPGGGGPGGGLGGDGSSDSSNTGSSGGFKDGSDGGSGDSASMSRWKAAEDDPSSRETDSQSDDSASSDTASASEGASSSLAGSKKSRRVKKRVRRFPSSKKRNKKNKANLGGQGKKNQNVTEGSSKGFKAPKKTRRKRGEGGEMEYEEGYLGEEILTDEDTRPPSFKADTQGGKDKADSSSANKAKKKASFKADKAGQSSKIKEDETAPLSFGKFIKYIVLVLFIIVVLIIIFSTIMEYQSRDE